MIVFVAVIVCAGALRFMWWFFPENPPPILQEEPVMFTFTSPELAHTTVPFNFLTPTDWAGSTVVTTAYYPNPSARFGPNTVVMVAIKDGWRFVEISEMPNEDLNALIATLDPNWQQTVAVAEGVEGKLLGIWSGRIRCKEPSRDGTLPGQCDTTRALVFSRDGVTIAIAADGNHPTDGELIAIARSMSAPTLIDVDSEPTP